MKNDKHPRPWLMDLAYIRDGKIVYTDEAVILACLVHTRGKGRKGRDMTDVQRIMKDKNLDKSR